MYTLRYVARLDETQQAVYPSTYVPDWRIQFVQRAVVRTISQQKTAPDKDLGLIGETVTNIARTAIICLTVAIASVASPIAAAQKTPDVPPAPVPVQILTARKIFIANGDSDPFLGAPNLAYNEFYATLKSMGTYELVRTPADADMVLEIRFEVVFPAANVLRLAILDPKTGILLWRITEQVQPWAREATGRKNFDEAMANLVSDLSKLIVSPRATTGATTPGS
jgi:hypothetical protein